MNRNELVRTAVGAVRAPFAIADMQIARFRGQGSRVRVVPQTAMGLLDTLTDRIAPVETRTPSTAATAAPPAAPTQPLVADEPDDVDLVAAPAPEPPLADEHREEQLAAERTARERKATRANKSLSSIAQDLAVAEAVADAHEERARTEELDARDFGPKGS